MFQKEVAERIAHSPRSESYGISSVFVKACCDIGYFFTVHEDKFIPQPKEKFGVIYLPRNKFLLATVDDLRFHVSEGIFPIFTQFWIFKKFHQMNVVEQVKSEEAREVRESRLCLIFLCITVSRGPQISATFLDTNTYNFVF